MIPHTPAPLLHASRPQIHQKSPLFVGSASEVRRLQEFLKKKKGAPAAR